MTRQLGWLNGDWFRFDQRAEKMNHQEGEDGASNEKNFLQQAFRISKRTESSHVSDNLRQIVLVFPRIGFT